MTTTIKRIEKVLFARSLPTWKLVHVIFEDYIVKTGYNCGRCLVIKMDNEHFLIQEGQYKLHTCIKLSDEEVKETLQEIKLF